MNGIIEAIRLFTFGKMRINIGMNIRIINSAESEP